MQTDIWYDLVLRELVDGDDAVTERVKEAQAAVGAAPPDQPEAPATERRS